MSKKSKLEAPASPPLPLPALTGIDPDQTIETVNAITTELHQPNTDLLGHAVENHASGYEGFDPEVHAVGADGKPKFTKSGDYAKKRGRKAGGQALPEPGQPAAASLASPGPVVTKDKAEQAARTTCNLLFNGAQWLISDEWKPEKEEATGMYVAFTDYYMQRGIPNIPPEVGIVAAILAYAAPRFAMPKTQAKIRKIKNTLTGRAEETEEIQAE